MARVLVVDDDELVRSLVQAHLKQAGHRVLVASSAEEALATVLCSGPPDVAVLDIGLPDVHGFDLARRLRGICDGLPIVFLSANVDQQHIDDGRDLGATYLTTYVRSALCTAVEKAAVPVDGW